MEYGVPTFSTEYPYRNVYKRVGLAHNGGVQIGAKPVPKRHYCRSVIEPKITLDAV